MPEHSLFFCLFLQKMFLKIPQIFLIIFCLAISSCNKNVEADSFPNLSGPSYEKLSRKGKIVFLDSVQLQSILYKNDKRAREFHFEMATQYYYLNEPYKSNQLTRKILESAALAKDTIDIARANYYLGDTYEIAKKDSAYYYYLEAEKLYRIKGEKEGIARMLFNKAYILFYEGNYVESEIELAEALKLLIGTDKSDLLYSAYTLMGANMERLEEFDEAIKYYSLAQNLLPTLEKDNSNFDNQYNYRIVLGVNIANIYEQQEQYDKAISELEKLLTPEIRSTWPSEYSKALSNLAYSKMKIGDISQVEEMFLEALRISEKFSNNSETLYKLNNLGEFYLISGDTLQARNYLKRSLQIGEEIRNGDEIKIALKLLAKADSENAPKYESRYLFLSDSLAKAQRKNRNKYAKIEYETVLLEGQNKTLSEKYSNILVISGILLLLIISLLILRYFTNQRRELESQRQKQRADEEIFDLLKEQQIKILQTKEEEQNRISRDLHDGILNKIYGVRLQLGILNKSDEEEIKSKRMKYIDMLQQIEKEIRGLSHDLHVDQYYNQFDFNSLLGTLIQAQNDLNVTKFEIAIASEIDWNAVSGLIKITTYRILQEATHNVIKYAEANSCRVTIKRLTDEIVLNISDDGKGFEMTNADGGIGLKNMRDRAKDINAQFKIDSWPGRGTQIEMRVKS